MFASWSPDGGHGGGAQADERDRVEAERQDRGTQRGDPEAESHDRQARVADPDPGDQEPGSRDRTGPEQQQQPTQRRRRPRSRRSMKPGKRRFLPNLLCKSFRICVKSDVLLSTILLFVGIMIIKIAQSVNSFNDSTRRIVGQGKDTP